MNSRLLKTTATSAIITGTILIIGCGGPERHVILVNNDDLAMSRSASLETGAPPAPIDMLNTMTAALKGVPRSGLLTTDAAKWDVRYRLRRQEDLLRMTDRIKGAVVARDFVKAAIVLENHLIFSADTVNGDGLRYFLYPSLAAKILSMAQETNAIIKPIAEQQIMSGAAAADWVSDALAISILSGLDAIRAEIANAPFRAFTLVAGLTINILLDVVKDATDIVTEGYLGDAQSLMIDVFYPSVDGGEGGDLSDEIFNAQYYTTQNYLNIMALYHQFVGTHILKGIIISPASAKVAAGETLQLVASCLYANAAAADCTKAVSWTSGNPAVGSVVSGLFTALAGGASQVAAALNGMTAFADILVEAAPTLGDSFSGSSVDRRVWPAIYSATGDTLSVSGGKLKAAGRGLLCGQILFSQPLKIDFSKTMEFRIDLDLGASSGAYIAQGIGFANRLKTLIIGIASGTTTGGKPILYYISPRESGKTALASRAASIHVVWQNSRAQVFVNGSNYPSLTFNAGFDGEDGMFYLYTSGVAASYGAEFDNYWTNQSIPVAGRAASRALDHRSTQSEFLAGEDYARSIIEMSLSDYGKIDSSDWQVSSLSIQ